MTKNEFIDRRIKIISKMLDNPDKYGIYPTTICYAELDDLFDELTATTKSDSERGASWAQIERDSKNETSPVNCQKEEK